MNPFQFQSHNLYRAPKTLALEFINNMSCVKPNFTSSQWPKNVKVIKIEKLMQPKEEMK